MDMRKLIVWFIVWVIAVLVAIPKSRNEELSISKTTNLPSIKEIFDKEIARIEEEKIVEEFERKREREKRISTSRGFRSVPNGNTSMKSYMDYRKITNKSSAQYQLQQRDDVYTDKEGFRKIGDRYIVAVGTYYSNTVGDCIRVELSEGGIFEAIVGDIKDNSHTDSRNQQHKVDGSVVEFIVDVKNINTLCKKMGDMSYAEDVDLTGNIVSIEILGNINE